MLSVIVLTYNSELEKLKKTLVSILKQKEIDFEIIVADDGSKINLFNEIETIFTENNFNNYLFVENKVNQGTIKNYLSGLEVAKGDYIYGISAGDFLFDEFTLKNFYEFAIKRKINILFGDVIAYIKKENEINIDLSKVQPKNPTIFENEKDFIKAKREFIFGEHITGPGYLRKKEVAIYYFNELLQYDLKYVEDNTSSALALLDDIRIVHYDRPICWYEAGTGITADKNKLVKNEFKKIYNKLKQEKNNPIIDCECIKINVQNNFKLKLMCILKHPVLYFKHILYMIKNKNFFYYRKYDVVQLKTQLKNAYFKEG